MLNAHVDSLGHDSAIMLQKHGSLSKLCSLHQDAIGLLQQMYMFYLLVDHNTYSSLCDIPHLAGAAVIHLVGHTLEQPAKNVRHSTDGRLGLLLKLSLCR